MDHEQLIQFIQRIIETSRDAKIYPSGSAFAALTQLKELIYAELSDSDRQTLDEAIRGVSDDFASMTNSGALDSGPAIHEASRKAAAAREHWESLHIRC